MSNLLYQGLSNRVLGCAFKVHSVMGPGLLESAYEGAMEVELKRNGLFVERQKTYALQYAGEYIGAYFADMVVEGKVILELKAVEMLSGNMKAQVINYLKLSGLQVGYLMNFYNERLVWRRYVVMHE